MDQREDYFGTTFSRVKNDAARRRISFSCSGSRFTAPQLCELFLLAAAATVPPVMQAHRWRSAVAITTAERQRCCGGPRSGGRTAEPASAGQQPSRRRFVYHITQQGREAHAAWVRRPVNPATITTDLPLHVMRFVMMERVLPRADVLAFLTQLRDALAAYLAGLEGYAAAITLPGQHTPLALDHGIATYTASLAWTKRTINALSRAPARTPTAE
jgi:hypothetical protein